MHGLFALGRGQSNATLRAAGATTASGLKTQTLGQLLVTSGERPFIDGFNDPYNIVSYKKVLENELNNKAYCPFTVSGAPINFRAAELKTPTVAVIGGGMSGLVTSLQLMKAGFQVSMLEARPKPDDSADISQAGRIFTANLRNGDSDTSVELGAMRFPSRSYLFWHYAKFSELLGDNDSLMQFPNVGEVPSIFRSRDGSDASGPSTTYGIWKQNTALVMSAYDQALQQRHLDAFRLFVPSSPSNEKKFNTEQIKAMIQAGTGAVEVHKWWRRACKQIYGMSYKNFLININKFSESEVERIGYIGLGTGGFAPLMGVSALEMMRLYIWDYADEYAVPQLKSYPKKLLQMIERLSRDFEMNGGTNKFIPYHNAAVDRVYYSGRYDAYRVEVKTPKGTFNLGVDYIVLAMTHTAAQNLLLQSARDVKFDVQYKADDLWGPYLDARLTKGPIAKGLSEQSMMPAVKYFHTMRGPNITAYPSTQATNSLEPARCLFGDAVPALGIATLGTSYVLPLSNPSEWSRPFSKLPKVIGLHYSWGAESGGFANQLRPYVDLSNGCSVDTISGNDASYTVPSTYVVAGVAARFANVKSNCYIPPKSEGVFSHDYATGLLSGVAMNRAVVEWGNVPWVWGGFKLDNPGRGVELIYSYRVLSYAVRGNDLVSDQQTVSLTWEPYYRVHRSSKRCYFAGDSFSHYGGWVEGAFQSAINVTAGIVRAHVADYPALSGNFYGFVKKEVCDMLLFGACDPYSYANGEVRPI